MTKRLAWCLPLLLALTACPRIEPNDTANTNENANTNEPPPAEDTTYSGRGTVLRTSGSMGETAFVDTGALPAEGGALEAAQLDISLANLLTADALHASTIGGNGVVRSEASISDLRIAIAEHELTADFLMSRTEAGCRDGAAYVEGRFEIANLVIDGEPIPVDVGENQEIPLRNRTGEVVGRAVLNEVVRSTEGATGEITVNALRFTVNGVVDLVMYHSHSDIHCAISEPGGDFITGGGRIDRTPTGTPAAFGVAGGTIDGVLWGHLNYVDRTADVHVRGTAVTGYEIVNDTTRRITGNAEINGVGGFTYTVESTDNGEPGTLDTFNLALSSGYQAGGLLARGNIQLHRLGE